MPRIPTLPLFGGMLTSLTVLLGIFSWQVDPSGEAGKIWLLLLLWAAMSLVYAGACLGIFFKKWPVTIRQVLFWAAMMRLGLVYSQPILETDYYRYMWDGYVTQQGVNPYRYSPFTVLHSMETAQPNADAELERLIVSALQNEEAEAILRRVNHPDYPTIYPPFAQWVFAFSTFVFPFSVHGWRLFILLFDASLIAALLKLLHEWNLDTNRVIVYAWSPLALKEFVNTAHVDIIALACLFIALWFFHRKWKVPGGVVLAAAVLCKWFPLMLLPMWSKKMGWKGMTAFILGCALIAGPFYFNLPVSWQGTAAFGLHWEGNSSLVTIVERLLDALGLPGKELEQKGISIAGIEATLDSFLLAKAICFLIAASAVVWFAWKIHCRPSGNKEEWHCTFLLVGIILLCSPVAHPWYIAWIVPFLCFYPSKAWLYLSCACLAFYSVFMSRPYNYPFWLRMFEYGPFAILAWMEWRRRKAVTSDE